MKLQEKVYLIFKNEETGDILDLPTTKKDLVCGIGESIQESVKKKYGERYELVDVLLEGVPEAIIEINRGLVTSVYSNVEHFSYEVLDEDIINNDDYEEDRKYLRDVKLKMNKFVC